MEPERTPTEQPASTSENLHKVKPLSKYLAVVLFVILPSISVWIGYTLAPHIAPEVEEVQIIQQNQAETEYENINEVRTDYFLTTDGSSFEISTSSINDKTVVFESDSKILFDHPWFAVGPESELFKTTGTQLNNKYYVSLWIQDVNDVISADVNNSYHWYLGEYDLSTGKFQLLLDSTALELDETYTEDKALYLSPNPYYENEAGHMLLSVILCEGCGPGPEHYATYNYETRELTLLGRATEFEWTSTSTYRYKTESELGISRLDTGTKAFVEEHYRNCNDHPISCYQQIDWDMMPWLERSI